MVHRVKNLMSRAHKMITVLFLCSRTREFNLGGGVGWGGHSSNSVEKKLKKMMKTDDIIPVLVLNYKFTSNPKSYFSCRSR